MVKKLRSYVIFKDGHEEDLLCYDKTADGKAIFVTKSGKVYRYYPPANRQYAECIKWRDAYFERLDPDFDKETQEIERVVLDERVWYDFTLWWKDQLFCDSILASPNASEDELRRLILKDVVIKCKKKE